MPRATPKQIGERIRARRLELQLKQDQLSGVSPATVRKIENGTEPNPTPRTRANLAAALRWQQDAYDVLSRGGTPAVSSNGALSVEDRLSSLEARFDRVEGAVEELLRRAGG